MVVDEASRTDAPDAGQGDAPRLLLLDGHSLAYRAWFALPPENFSTATGQITKNPLLLDWLARADTSARRRTSCGVRAVVRSLCDAFAAPTSSTRAQARGAEVLPDEGGDQADDVREQVQARNERRRVGVAPLPADQDVAFDPPADVA